MATETKVTVIRVAEATAWVRLSADEENGSSLPLSDGGFAFEHGVEERIHSVDYSRVPNMKPREVPLGPGSSERMHIALCAMRVVFISEPVDPEVAAAQGTVVEVDQGLLDAQDKIIIPGR